MSRMCGFHEHNVRYSLAQCEVSIYDHNDSSEKDDSESFSFAPRH